MNIVTKNLRKRILETSFKNQAGHIPSAFSILEIIYFAYSEFLTEDDVFLLSKGHGCLALYAVFNNIQNLNDWRQYLQRATTLSHQIQQMANYLQENDKLSSLARKRHGPNSHKSNVTDW